jgi:hypothetical protein
MTGPSAEVCAEIHSEMFADRKGKNLDAMLSKMVDGGFCRLERKLRKAEKKAKH